MALVPNAAGALSEAKQDRQAGDLEDWRSRIMGSTEALGIGRAQLQEIADKIFGPEPPSLTKEEEEACDQRGGQVGELDVELDHLFRVIRLTKDQINRFGQL